jgi:hypothetical protein
MLGLTLKSKKGILSGWRILNSEFRMGKGNWEGGKRESIRKPVAVGG